MQVSIDLGSVPGGQCQQDRAEIAVPPPPLCPPWDFRRIFPDLQVGTLGYLVNTVLVAQTGCPRRRRARTMFTAWCPRYSRMRPGTYPRDISVCPSRLVPTIS